MTLEQIRAALPTHIMLTQMWHVQPKDELYEGEWSAITKSAPKWAGIKYKETMGVVRRAIPPHILDNQAFWLRFGESAPRERAGTKEEHNECAVLRPDKNGGAAFYVQSTAGRLYDKWLLEQMEGV